MASLSCLGIIPDIRTLTVTCYALGHPGCVAADDLDWLEDNGIDMKVCCAGTVVTAGMRLPSPTIYFKNCQLPDI